MEPAGQIEIPQAWENLRFSGMKGVILVVGAADTGKTTFARYLYRRLCVHRECVAFVDGDMGQATLGPPTTMTLALRRPNCDSFPPAGPRFRAFIGDISPTRHLLQTVVAAHKLVEKARDEGAEAIVFDTTGLVTSSQGGGALKRALVDLLGPEVVVAIQRGTELEHLLVPLRQGHRPRVINRSVVGAVQRRGIAARRKHRAEQFRRAFRKAGTLEVSWLSVPVIPFPLFTQHRLVALEDEDGFVLALGIVTGLERDRQVVELHTPLTSLAQVYALRVGDLAVDPQTFRDTRL
jgi:polynucleotide 5'-hydroxyl-kinase GRC3/NOL9